MDLLFKEAIVDALADTDCIYQEQMRALKLQEKELNLLIRRIPDDQRALIWEYIMLCEDMSIRKLQLACKYMKFCGINEELLFGTDDIEQRKKEAKQIAHKIRNADI